MSTFRVLPGLPSYGLLPVHFGPSGGGQHSEGFVVEFSPKPSSAWVGNFQLGATQFNSVLDHPNGNFVIVIAGGEGYIINPRTREAVEIFGAAINCLFEVPSRNQVIFGNGLWFESYGESGHQWKTRRISWDGMRTLRLVGKELRGEAWDAAEDRWIPFLIDVWSGNVVGGAMVDGPEST